VIGLTLVVAGDSFFLTLFAVILFHQMFEGIALGTCIAGLPSTKASFLQKSLMATAFALITPIGMAIGIGVLNHFNGNDPSTLIAIGTLDALSAGILAWVGLVEMLARDWLHGPLLNAGMVKTGAAMVALLAGMILMSVLGKWA
jgi:zinc transporter 1/2/3